MHLNFGLVKDAAPELLGGLQLTLLIFAFGVAGMLAVAVVGASLRISTNRAVSGAVAAFVEFFRNTPPLLQIYFLFFGLGTVPALRMPAIAAATLGLILHQGAIGIEILRAGLGAVPEGQREASEALGLSRLDQLRYVLVPQAIRISLPAMGNNVISLLKNTTLVSSIGVLDFLGVANDKIAIVLVSAEFYLTVAAIYVILVGVLGAIFRAIERRLAMSTA